MTRWVMICRETREAHYEQRRIFLEKAARNLSDEITYIQTNRDTADEIRKAEEDGSSDGLYDPHTPGAHHFHIDR